MDKQLDSVYDPHLIEQAIYQQWEESGNFSPSNTGAPYCIMIPPPNVTGSLHMGHAFQNTLMDALIRYHRMKGHNTLWQVGTDHAGIATQMVVERLLNSDGVSRIDLGRDAFIDKVWQWKANSGGTITNQLRRLGASVDWSRERFTMDEDLSNAVREVFVSLYEDGLIYRGKRLVNWDPVLLTAISDLEVNSEEEDGHLWHFRYPITDSNEFVVIATTRPETMLGDTAVAVHPDDERYSHLVGKTVTLPLVNRVIPVVADNYVDPEFGSGCVKITPAHDFNDYEVGQRHDLDMINVMTPQASIDLPGTRYHRMTREAARDAVVSDLEELELVEKVEPHKYKVPRGDRTGQIIEPYLTDQWFVKAKPLADPSIEAVKDGTIRFVPKNWERTYFDWMENIEDWCISRQIWWGHRIPAWYDEDGNTFVARSVDDAVKQAVEFHGNEDFELRQDNDVLDTWFSSALWPFSTLGWPQESDAYQTFYPTNVLVTGFDIIFFWVARMIMFGLKFADGIPFHEVYIHGLVRDSEGQKMSKSKGNILDPLDLIDGIDLEPLIRKRTTGLMQPDLAPLIEKATRKEFPHGIPAYGTDALRFTFARLATQGRDIRFDLGRIEGYRNFCNKLWNAARFVLMNTKEVEVLPINQLNCQTAIEKWIVSELQHTADEIQRAFEVYRFDIASKYLYEFIWNEFCAWFIEFSKILMRDSTIEEDCQQSVRQTLLSILDASVRMLHPFMP
ncbi:MAG: valine--tRNA ligase, partial [Gammaproteobacteria bacterium]|nr:valine--tRNA ligase [Gammaproteobacteria bacterium]